MILSSQLRPGMAIRFDNHTYRVLAADYHSGQGKMGGSCHARLRDLSTGALWEHAFRADLKLEDLTVEKLPFTFVYRDGDDCVFMDPTTFDQISIPASVAGSYADFFEPDLSVTIEFVDGATVGVLAPDALEVVIADTAPPIHGSDQVWKPAALANGVSVMVPPFIKAGDAIRIDLANRRYMDRAKPQNK